MEGRSVSSLATSLFLCLKTAYTLYTDEHPRSPSSLGPPSAACPASRPPPPTSSHGTPCPHLGNALLQLRGLRAPLLHDLPASSRHGYGPVVCHAQPDTGRPARSRTVSARPTPVGQEPENKETQINGQSAAWPGIHGPRTPPGPALDQALGAGTDTAMRPSPPAALASLTRISSGLSVGLERAEKVSPAVLQRQRLGCFGGGDGATDPGRSQWDGFLLSTILPGPQPWRPGTQSFLSCFGQLPCQTRSVTRIGREHLETARCTHTTRTGGIAACRTS